MRESYCFKLHQYSTGGQSVSLLQGRTGHPALHYLFIIQRSQDSLPRVPVHQDSTSYMLDRKIYTILRRLRTLSSSFSIQKIPSPHAVRICQQLSGSEVCILSVHVSRATCIVMSISGPSEDIFTKREPHVRLLSQL